MAWLRHAPLAGWTRSHPLARLQCWGQCSARLSHNPKTAAASASCKPAFGLRCVERPARESTRGARIREGGMAASRKQAHVALGVNRSFSGDLMVRRADNIAVLNARTSVGQLRAGLHHFRVSAGVVGICIRFGVPQTDSSDIQPVGAGDRDLIPESLLFAE